MWKSGIKVQTGCHATIKYFLHTCYTSIINFLFKQVLFLYLCHHPRMTQHSYGRQAAFHGGGGVILGCSAATEQGTGGGSIKPQWNSVFHISYPKTEHTDPPYCTNIANIVLWCPPLNRFLVCSWPLLFLLCFCFALLCFPCFALHLLRSCSLLIVGSRARHSLQLRVEEPTLKPGVGQVYRKSTSVSGDLKRAQAPFEKLHWLALFAPHRVWY